MCKRGKSLNIRLRRSEGTFAKGGSDSETSIRSLATEYDSSKHQKVLWGKGAAVANAKPYFAKNTASQKTCRDVNDVNLLDIKLRRRRSSQKVGNEPKAL